MDSAAPPRSHRESEGHLAASDPVSRQSGRRAFPRLEAGCQLAKKVRLDLPGRSPHGGGKAGVDLGRAVRSESLVRGDFRPRVSSVWERVASSGGRGTPSPGVGGVGAVAMNVSE